MEADLPEDLTHLKSWATEAIEAASTLQGAEDAKQLTSARDRLAELLVNLPEISDCLARELTTASDHYQREDPACFGGIPARHPLDAIQELCWQTLEHSLQQTKAMLQLRVALHRHVPKPNQPEQRECNRLAKAIASIDRLQENRTDLRQLLPKLRNTLNQFPASARPSLDRSAPALSQPLSHRDKLDVLLQKVLDRVWRNRLERQTSTQREPGAAQSDSGLQAPKKRSRGRRRQYDPVETVRLVNRWRNRDRSLRTYEQFARELGGGYRAEDIKRALDRHRKPRRK